MADQKPAPIATAAGNEKTLAETFMVTEDGLREVLGEERRLKRMGIDGVPGVVVDGQFLFSGAAEPQVIAEAFRTACPRS